MSTISKYAKFRIIMLIDFKTIIYKIVEPKHNILTIFHCLGHLLNERLVLKFCHTYFKFNYHNILEPFDCILKTIYLIHIFTVKSIGSNL